LSYIIENIPIVRYTRSFFL